MVHIAYTARQTSDVISFLFNRSKSEERKKNEAKDEEKCNNKLLLREHALDWNESENQKCDEK